MKDHLIHYFNERRPAVLVVGDVMCDVYQLGQISRISSEAPVPIFCGQERQYALGGAANVAANLSALGCQVYLLGVIGTDAAGSRVRELLQQQGIADTWLIEDAERPTTEKTRLIAHNQQVLRLDRESQVPLSPSHVSKLLNQAETVISEVDGLICSDYNKGTCSPEFLKALFELANSSGSPIIVDPKARDFTRYRKATVLTPNLNEVENALGIRLDGPSDLRHAAELLMHQNQAEAILVTRGKDGMTLFHPPQSPLDIPARAREVFDVTGAGDTVTATLCMAMVSGLSIAESANLANIAASIVVGKIGTAVVSLPELLAALTKDAISHQQKLFERNELGIILRHHQHRGEKIVSTNGCFDLLHIGHIQFLQQARSLGDRLVVALNDDTSVRSLKGENRPVMPQQERARVLAALECVDYVTMFNERTPVAVLGVLQPDIHVKGGDYTVDELVERETVEAHGGKIQLLPYIQGVSTTRLIDIVVERYASSEQAFSH